MHVLGPDICCTDRDWDRMYFPFQFPKSDAPAQTDRRVTAGERNKMKLERMEEMINAPGYLCRPQSHDRGDVSDLEANNNKVGFWGGGSGLSTQGREDP